MPLTEGVTSNDFMLANPRAAEKRAAESATGDGGFLAMLAQLFFGAKDQGSPSPDKQAQPTEASIAEHCFIVEEATNASVSSDFLTPNDVEGTPHRRDVSKDLLIAETGEVRRPITTSKLSHIPQGESIVVDDFSSFEILSSKPASSAVPSGGFERAAQATSAETSALRITNSERGRRMAEPHRRPELLALDHETDISTFEILPKKVVHKINASRSVKVGASASATSAMKEMISTEVPKFVSDDIIRWDVASNLKQEPEQVHAYMRVASELRAVAEKFSPVIARSVVMNQAEQDSADRPTAAQHGKHIAPSSGSLVQSRMDAETEEIVRSSSASLKHESTGARVNNATVPSTLVEQTSQLTNSQALPRSSTVRSSDDVGETVHSAIAQRETKNSNDSQRPVSGERVDNTIFTTDERASRAEASFGVETGRPTNSVSVEERKADEIVHAFSRAEVLDMAREMEPAIQRAEKQPVPPLHRISGHNHHADSSDEISRNANSASLPEDDRNEEGDSEDSEMGNRQPESLGHETRERTVSERVPKFSASVEADDSPSKLSHMDADASSSAESRVAGTEENGRKEIDAAVIEQGDRFSVEEPKLRQRAIPTSERMQNPSPVHDPVLLKANTVEPQASEKLPTLPPDFGSELMTKAAEELRLHVAGKSAGVRVVLRPETLGELTIRATMHEGKIAAHIHVQEPAVKAALEAQVPVLREVLLARGIDIQRFEIVTGGSEMHFHNPDEGRASHQPPSGFRRRHKNVDGAEEDDAVRSLGYNTVEYII